MALAPWNVLAGGRIRTDEEEERRRKTGENGEFATTYEGSERQSLTYYVVVQAVLPL